MQRSVPRSPEVRWSAGFEQSRLSGRAAGVLFEHSERRPIRVKENPVSERPREVPNHRRTDAHQGNCGSRWDISFARNWMPNHARRKRGELGMKELREDPTERGKVHRHVVLGDGCVTQPEHVSFLVVCRPPELDVRIDDGAWL